MPLLGGVRILARGGDEVVLVVEEELQEEEVDAHPSDRLRFSLPMQEYAEREGPATWPWRAFAEKQCFLLFFFRVAFSFVARFFSPNLRNTSKNRKHKSKHVSESDTECERGLKN